MVRKKIYDAGGSSEAFCTEFGPAHDYDKYVTAPLITWEQNGTFTFLTYLFAVLVEKLWTSQHGNHDPSVMVEVSLIFPL